MEARRHFHGHHGRRGGSSGGGRGFHRSRRGSGAAGGPGRSALRFKGDGYNDYEVVSIAEEVVGISGFLDAQRPGFSGVLKQRFSDFVVHEISPSGRRVALEVLAKKPKSAPSAFHDLALSFLRREPRTGEERAPGVKDKRPVDACEVIVRALTRKLQAMDGEATKRAHAAQEQYNLRKLVALVAKEIGAKKGKEFEEFLDKIEQSRAKFEAEWSARAAAKAVASASAPSAAPSPLSSPGAADRASAAQAAAAATEGLTFYIGGLNDKADRVLIHESMRRYGSSRIVADTLNIGGDTSVIRIRPAFVTQFLPGERDSRRDWPVGQPEYLQFTLYKRNKDTAAVVNQLAASLKMPASLFSYADAKDKRGISTQLCTVYRLPKERAQQVLKPSVTRPLDEQSHLVGDLRYTHHKLQLGDCRGNHIAAVIRSLADEDALPESQVRAAVASWAARGFINFFGLPRFGTTGPTSHHLVGRAMLRKDFKLAVLLLLRPQEGEASKIREAREHFRQHKDVAAALRMLPPFLVAERAILEGLQQNGVEAHELAFRNVPKPIRAAYMEAYQCYVWNEMASLRMGSTMDSTLPMVGDLVLVESTSEETGEPARKKLKRTLTKRIVRQRVAVLTAETVAQYSMDDVVLPVPGHAVTYPSNAVGEAYHKMLATDGIDMSAHFEPDGSQQFELDGYYRHVVRKPSSVSFRLERYDDPTVPLIETDVDRLLKSTGAASANRSSAIAGSEPAGDDKRPAHRALVVEFELAFGSDATVALRELMKQSSSVHVSWQQGESVAGESKAAAGTGDAAAKTTDKPDKKSKKSAKSEPRKVITAQKKTQVAIGRPGFSLGRS